MKKQRLLFLVMLLIGSFTSLWSYQFEIFGNKQTGTVNRVTQNRFGVIIKDVSGHPVPNIPVEFVCSDTTASLQTEYLFTNKSGVAATYLQYGKEMRDYKVKAKIYLPNESKEAIVDFVFTAFDWKRIIFYVLGGLGLFLFGITLVSDSLKVIAGSGLKKFLQAITSNRVMGVGVGCIITSILQSSSAVTVMTLGFVNAGLLTLRQAIGVIFGANIGTTMTAQIIAFNIGEIALPAIAIGAGMVIFSKSLRVRSWGNVVLGFGLLFFGLNTMTDVLKPISNCSMVKDAFVTLSQNHLMAVMVGTIVTLVVQSSSATVGITMALAAGHLIDLPAAMGLVLGDNIGTTITAVLASLGSDTNTKRAAAVHVTFNTIGAMYVMIALYLFEPFIVKTFASLSGDINHQVANFHSIFNVFNALAFLPFVVPLQKFVTWLIPDSSTKKSQTTQYLSDNLLAEPALAIDQVKLELGQMLLKVRATMTSAVGGLTGKGQIMIQKTYELEDVTDQYQSEITEYIVKISQNKLTSEQASRIPVLIHITNDFEKVADFARNVAEISEKKLEKVVEFDEEQREVIRNMHSILEDMFTDLLVAFETHDKAKARKILHLEDQLNLAEIRHKKQQIRSLSSGKSAYSAIMIIDLITNFEKAGDHLVNVAQAILGSLSDDDKALYSDILLSHINSEGVEANEKENFA